jgi:hypothetical protein
MHLRFTDGISEGYAVVNTLQVQHKRAPLSARSKSYTLPDES